MTHFAEVPTEVPSDASTDSLALRVRGLTMAVSAALFVVACMLPAIHDGGAGPNTPVDPGWLLLVTGIAGPIVGSFEWFANVLWLLSLWSLHRRRWRKASIQAAFAVLLSALTLTRNGRKTYTSGLGNVPIQFDGFYAGYYLWLAAMCVLLLGAAYLWWLQPPAPSPPSHPRRRNQWAVDG
ncbi:MAG: hypothetical protein JO040_11045 [Gemmatimonadetes bacterium]|nr:hypothetical protein [Gemmatimonadota bacterium]